MTNILFVYNAKSGKINALLDAGHKLLSPSTYKCNLCALTYDTFSENKKWKSFRKSSDVYMQFFHSDEFEEAFPAQNFKYPVVIKQHDNSLDILLNKNDLENINSVDELIDRIKSTTNYLK